MQIFERQISTIDAVELDAICPHCGCAVCDVIHWPRSNQRGWWRSQQGRARCMRCRETFEIVFEEKE